MAAVAAVFVGSQFLGVGEVLDVVAGGVTVLTVGWDGIRGLRGFVRFYQRAVHAQSDEDMNAAARLFADAMLAAISAIGWAKLGKLLGKGIRQTAALAITEDAAAQIARWQRYIGSLEFKVPRDKGILWSKLGLNEVEKLTDTQGVFSLETFLKENGFSALYDAEFGKTKNDVTKKIWEMVSTKYVQSLEGQVTGYVRRTEFYQHLEANAEKAAIAAGKNADSIHQFKQIKNAGDPVIITELEEISEILQSNSKITEVVLVDFKTGEAFGYRSREFLESLKRLEQRGGSR
jgi:hypothetical protein